MQPISVVVEKLFACASCFRGFIVFPLPSTDIFRWNFKIGYCHLFPYSSQFCYSELMELRQRR
jgi:hypothetical protein